MKPKTVTAYEVFLSSSDVEMLLLPEGAVLQLLKRTRGNDLFAASLLIQEFQRISLDEDFLAKERRGFEAWEKCMKPIEKKPVRILLSEAVGYTFDEVYFKMYGSRNDLHESTSAWRKRIKITGSYVAYLLCRGLLRLSCNESEVSI